MEGATLQETCADTRKMSQCTYDAEKVPREGTAPEKGTPAERGETLTGGRHVLGQEAHSQNQQRQ